jgi:hypothetical protein|tara:strand:- start:209 stop:403 length:195 start_codon:yes stop_codon:yes gene_type:complete
MLFSMIYRNDDDTMLSKTKSSNNQKWGILSLSKTMRICQQYRPAENILLPTQQYFEKKEVWFHS